MVTLISTFLLTSSLLVILVESPIHAILLLVLVFFNGSILLILLKLEFMALIFFIVYVGAIVVLFLFIVMLVRLRSSQEVNSLRTTIIFLVLTYVFIGALAYVDTVSLPEIKTAYLLEHYNFFEWVQPISHIQAIGYVLYNEFVVEFLIIGALLFMAMVAAIVLTVKETTVKDYWTVAQQTSRKQENAIYLI